MLQQQVVQHVCSHWKCVLVSQWRDKLERRGLWVGIVVRWL